MHYRRVRVDGSSMLPTLHDGEFVLVNKLAYHIGSPTRGDIIVFQSTTEKDLDLIKRVIGLPGDHIVIGGWQSLRQWSNADRALYRGRSELFRRMACAEWLFICAGR